MEIDRSLIGTEADPYVVEVEKGAIRRFAEAIGDTNPLYHDEAFARGRGYGGIVAPPTFATTFRQTTRPPWIEPLDDRRILAGEQLFCHQRPIVAGDVLTCRLRFVRVDEREGRSGRMEIIVQDMEAADRAGRVVVRNTRSIVYRASGRLARREVA